FLIFFTLLSIAFTVALGFSSKNIFFALVCFALANFGCQEAIIFYNAMMTRVVSRGKIGLVSGVGRMFGYTGALLALYFTKPIILKMGYEVTFILTGALFLIFSLPCLIFVKDKDTENPEEAPREKESRNIFTRLKATIMDNELKEFKDLLKASFFVLCVVHTVILFMSVYATRAFGLNEAQIINLIAFSTLFAIGGSILSGLLSDRLGYRRSLVGVFFLWGLSILAGTLLRAPFYWLVGALAGLSLGGTWVILRALVIKLVPEEKIGEAFGIFNLVSYAAGVIGPLIWGVMLLFCSRFGEWGYRLTFLSQMPFIIIGIYFLLKSQKTLKE
ncbi:MFS transporter, partial [Candidatus Omnitrophota bacterium]